MIRTRSPSNPRITGRLDAGPIPRFVTPASFCSVSPRLPDKSLLSSNKSSDVMALNCSKVVAAPRVLVVTVTDS